MSEEVVVTAEAPPASAQAKTLDVTDVAATPGRSADDLLRATRGLHQSAHGGHGKAFQYFLRGFDAVHGADLAVSLEGVPLNEVSNVHGHGYLDLHFLPRRLVLGATLEPGVFRASIADFGIAGSGELALGLAQPGLQLQVGAGTDQSVNGAVAFRPEDRGPGTFGVLEAEAGNGVGPSRAWQQVRAALGVDGSAGDVALRTFVLAYRGDFESPGVLREADVELGREGFYGSYDNSGSGSSSRVLGAVRAEARPGRWRASGTAWSGWRSLELRQNYTGAAVSPEHGDGTLQAHEAFSGGLVARAAWRPVGAIGLDVGGDVRFDHIVQSEAGIEPDGDVWDPRIDTSVVQRGLGVFAAIPARPVDWLALEGGLRAQVFLVDLDRRLDGGLGLGKARANAPVLAPRASARLLPDGPITVLAAYGRGFRSPEARGVEDGRAPIPVSDGAELGVTWASHPVELRAGAFGTWISNEIVFDHATARFLTTGSTRRAGGYGGITVSPSDALAVELDVTGSDGRYAVTGEAIPYAPRWLAVLATSTRALVTGPVVWVAGTRTFYLGPRPLPGGFASHAAWVTDLTLQARVRAWTVDLDVDNVFVSRWRDGEFFYASDWDGRASALPQRHFTAGAPFAVRAALGWRI